MKDSNGGDQHRLEGWKHLLPDSEEKFMNVLDEKLAAQADDEADAEEFEIWEDDDVAEEEQADEVAEEPVFACGVPRSHPDRHVQMARSSLILRQCVCKGLCSCKLPSVTIVHLSSSTMMCSSAPDDTGHDVQHL